jgi:hypothetical protein
METLALRCLSSSASVGRGLVILRRTADLDLLEGIDQILAIARRPFRMPPPFPGVHEAPLLESAEASWFGYTG